MFCSQCGKLLSKIDGFCGSCGATTQSCRESLPLKHFTSERDAITEYFTAGYSLSSIESFLKIYHNINISKRTLKRRLKKYGLRRRLAPDNNSVVTAVIERELSGLFISVLAERIVRHVYHLFSHLKTRPSGWDH